MTRHRANNGRNIGFASDAVDQLIEADRITQQTVHPSQTLGPSVEYTPEQREQIVARVQHYMKSKDIRPHQVGKEINHSRQLVYMTLRLEYTGDQDGVLADLDRWLEGRIKADQVKRPTGFVRTTIARRIAGVAAATCKLGGIGMVFGESGIGKTLALQAVAAERPGAIYCQLDVTRAAPGSLLLAIAEAMKAKAVKRATVNTAGKRYDLLREALQGSNRLLIIDQVHRLCSGGTGDKALYTLADLHDVTGCPMLWAGTIDLVAYLERRELAGQEPLAQLRRRIAISLDLMEEAAPSGSPGSDRPGQKLFTVEEVRQVLAQSKLKLTDGALRYATDLANLEGQGHLGDVVALVTMASLLNAQASTLTEDMLRQAHHMLASRRSREYLSARMEAVAHHEARTA